MFVKEHLGYKCDLKRYRFEKYIPERFMTTKINFRLLDY